MRMSRLARQRLSDRAAAQRAIAQIDWATPLSPFVRTLAAWEVSCTMTDKTAEWLSVYSQQRHPDAPPDWARTRLIRESFYTFEGALRFWRGLVKAEEWLIDELSLSKAPSTASP